MDIKQSRATRVRWPQLQTPINPVVHEDLLALKRLNPRGVSDIVRTAVGTWVALPHDRLTELARQHRLDVGILVRRAVDEWLARQ